MHKYCELLYDSSFNMVVFFISMELNVWIKFHIINLITVFLNSLWIRNLFVFYIVPTNQ